MTFLPKSIFRMTHTNRPAFIMATSLLVVAVASCTDDEKPKQKTPAAATGGASNNAGATSTVSTGVGGAGSGDASSSGGSTATGGSTDGQGGTSASGGTTSVEVRSCASDVDCKALQMLCDKTASRCVQCLLSTDCTDGKACVAGVCGGTLPGGCTSNADCASSADGKVCDVTRGRCVVCNVNADCPDPTNAQCINYACVASKSCSNSLACTDASAPICDQSTSPGRCVQCTADADCASVSATSKCSSKVCRGACSVNSDCASGTLCNTSSVPNVCMQCATNADCPSNEYCSAGNCVADICVAGTDQACINNAIVACSADGSGFAAPTPCGSGRTCKVAGSRATCDGGAGGAGGAGPTSCLTSPGTVNPCAKIPKYTGTQTVDGKGDDFCGVPSFELTFASAAGVNNNKVSGGSIADFQQRAVAQVAWSEDAFHAFVEVFGLPVRSNTSADKPWDGDAIELMVTTSNSVTGLTSKDGNALHFILNFGIGVSVKSDGTSGTHTAISGSGQFAGEKTAQGYAVELKYPWPGSPSLASGTQVRFDMAMNVDTESVDPTVQGRDAQAVLAMTTVSGSSSCANSPATPFCDDRIWCLTALE